MPGERVDPYINRKLEHTPKERKKKNKQTRITEKIEEKKNPYTCLRTSKYQRKLAPIPFDLARDIYIYIGNITNNSMAHWEVYTSVSPHIMRTQHLDYSLPEHSDVWGSCWKSIPRRRWPCVYVCVRCERACAWIFFSFLLAASRKRHTSACIFFFRHRFNEGAREIKRIPPTNHPYQTDWLYQLILSLYLLMNLT